MIAPRLIWAACCVLAACVSAQPLTDYADQPDAAWRGKLRLLAQGGDTVFRIVQAGDSHTAGGFFTDELRRRLQQQWGDAGIGWVFPQAVKGQRNSQIRYQGGWTALSSRKDRADFPFGGVLARSQNGQTLTLAPTTASAAHQQMTAAVRPADVQHQPLTVRMADGAAVPLYPLHGAVWQYADFSGSLPVSFRAADNETWELGAVNFENGHRGVTVSALGINGSQLAHWQQWRAGWDEDLAATRADLVILAYGTNEAFNPAWNEAAAEAQWRQSVRRIRAALPEAAVLIVGAPESLVSVSGRCGGRPPRLDAVQQMQQRVAQQEGLLYWSWQEAMGGQCSMAGWVKQKLAAADGVHFSGEGYRRAAAQLAQALIAAAAE